MLDGAKFASENWVTTVDPTPLLIDEVTIEEHIFLSARLALHLASPRASRGQRAGVGIVKDERR